MAVLWMGVTGMCLCMLTRASVSVLILWASEEAAGVLMGVREEDVTLECVAYSPEGSLRAWLSVRGVGGAGSRGGSPDQFSSLVEDVSFAASKPMCP